MVEEARAAAHRRSAGLVCACAYVCVLVGGESAAGLREEPLSEEGRLAVESAVYSRSRAGCVGRPEVSAASAPRLRPDTVV